MAKLVFGMQQSLDGYVDHLEMGPPGPALSRHFVEHVRDLAGCVYGRRTYEIMRNGTKTSPIGTRRISTSWRCGEACQSGLCRAH